MSFAAVDHSETINPGGTVETEVRLKRERAAEDWKRAREGKVEPAEGAIFCCVHHKRYAESQARKAMRRFDDFFALVAETGRQLGLSFRTPKEEEQLAESSAQPPEASDPAPDGPTPFRAPRGRRSAATTE